MNANKNTQQSDTKTALNLILKGPASCEGSRACLFNLIVYTHEPRRTTYFKKVVEMIKTQFPCRIIFITGNPLSKENYFNVKSSVEKNSDGSGFACEQIEIEAAGSDLNRVYFLLMPLFVPDLPIYLLWGQDPTTESTILPHLEYFATRLIFDAETTADLQQFSKAMSNRINTSPIQIVDMNWARIGGWREVFGDVYDSKERFEQLAVAKNIEVKFNNLPGKLFEHPETQAVYFQAWLASRLNWSFVKAEKQGNSQLIFYNNEQSNSCQISLTPIANQNFETEEIVEIEVFGDKDYACHMKRISPEQVKVQSSNQFECGLPFLLLMPTIRSGRSFMQDIFYQKTGDQYEKMLNLVSEVRWQ